MARLNLSSSLASDAAANLRRLLEHLATAGDASVLSNEQHRVLTENIDNLRATLERELGARHTYSSAPPCAATHRAPDDPAALFAPRVYAALPAMARFDIEEAARCTACELPTAAAFHLLRAVAAVLQAFYASNASWRRTADHTELFRRLGYLRAAFRDPCRHPDATFTAEEAQRLWTLSVEAISGMAPALKEAMEADAAHPAESAYLS